ncbi:hypothetical protein Bhyg_17704 [Pseudolycoriella hygida]
MDYG